MVRVYIASKTRHANLWIKLRHDGINIISTWIDESGVGETVDKKELAVRCIKEASDCDVCLVYAEEGEVLKGAYCEMGAALANGKPVLVVGDLDTILTQHPNVTQCLSIHGALAIIDARKDGDG